MTHQIPTTMRAIHVETPGGPDAMHIGDVPVPEVKADEVLIRVLAAGVNRPDIQQRKGAYPPPPGASPFLGLEAAGEVVARGSAVTMYNVGDKVTGLCNGGAYAEFVAVPATQCLPWPEGYTAIQAAALPENYFTVWANMFDLGALAPDETLLVHGGTSGIGITAIQFAVAQGSKVFATAGSAAKCDVIAQLGATAINYREQDFAVAIADATNKAGVNVVLDMVGAPYAAQNIASLARGGRLVQIAFMTGAVAEHFNMLPIMVKRLTITGSTMRPRTTTEKAAIAHSLLSRIWPQLEARLYAPIIHEVFPLAEAPRAHALMETSAHIGKIMLHVAD